MPSKNRFLLIALSILLIALASIWFTPFVVSHGLRLWIAWKARQQHWTVKIDKIDAPLWRPVVMRGIHLVSAPENSVTIKLDAKEASFALNLQAIVLQRGRALRTLSVQDFHAETQRHHAGAFLSESGWNELQRLFPLKFNFAGFNLRLEDGPTLILIRNASISGSEIEAGQFNAGEVTVTSPLFRQTFGQLRGATNWQGDRLTVAGLSLSRGLDLQWITIDLSQVRKQRLGLDFDMDAFGGKIRASIANEWLPRSSLWNVVGSATDISLAQTSEALGFTDHLGGVVHACKFGFRGDPRDPMQAAASVWTELTGLNWRDRAAEVIMLGASLYNRQIDIQQIYVKQSKNQLTLRGQAAFPGKSLDWLRPDFQGDISASINQLGDFAALFGANPGDFAGKISAEGTMSARDRKIGGHLTFDGTSLTLFRTGINSLSAKLDLKADELQIEQFELKRKNDLLTAQGKIDMSHTHNYSGTIKATVSNLADYLSIFRGPVENNSQPAPANLQVTIDASKWDAHGEIVMPGSNPFHFVAGFPLPIGTDWNAFRGSPINLTLEFPSIFLAKVPQFFHPEIFRDGILSGSLSVSGSLQHPQITGDVQMLNGKLQNAFLNLAEASSRITFAGDHASLDFFNAAAKDVDLSVRGELDFRDTNDVAVKMVGSTPVFDLTPTPIDCVSRIEINPVVATLASAVTSVELQGSLFRKDWKMILKERTSTQASTGPSLNEIERRLALCLGTNAQEKTLLLGGPPRPQPSAATPKKRKKQR
ncbi:MAG: hypothetical protein ABI925_08710 [Verrucomicrobiota bacterium]